MDEQYILCDECAAACARLAGARATEWSVNPVTKTVCGMVRWSDYETIAMGTESPCRAVAYLPASSSILKCREIPCSRRRTPERGAGTRPNTEVRQYPPNDDPRG